MDSTTDLLTRGVANIIPGKPQLEKLLNSDKKLNIYCGFDSTAPKLTLGHSVPFRKLQAFADAGHHVTFLIGDFTTRVGDTSDKESARPILTSEEIEANWQTYKKQASKFLNFDQIDVKFNSEWLSQLTFAEIVKLTQQFSLGDFISRELIKNRLTSGKHVSLQEVLYPVMQGYDHWYMDADLQIGATEQTFNMQAGRTLQKNWRHKETFIMTLDILEGTDGRKMSKSWGNAIWLEDTPQDVYGKVMSLKDELIIEYFTLATNLPVGEINDFNSQLTTPDSQLNPIDIKKRLAHQITLELHTRSAADAAQAEFERVHQQGSIPTDIPEFSTRQSTWKPVDLLTATGLAGTNSVARRLIEQGGLEIDNQKITDWQTSVIIKPGTIIHAGKRKFIKINHGK